MVYDAGGPSCFEDSDPEEPNAAYANFCDLLRAAQCPLWDDVSQPCRACFSSQNASHASGGVSAPNRHKSSSFYQIGKTGLGRVSISQGCTSKQRRRPMKPASSVGCPRKSFGNGSEDLDLEGNEPIDRDSYRECKFNVRIHVPPAKKI